jgi:hypothetical protein
MQMLLIEKCDDPMMWYADNIFELVPYRGKFTEGYKSVDNEGFTNIVKFDDAKLVEVDV